MPSFWSSFPSERDPGQVGLFLHVSRPPLPLGLKAKNSKHTHSTCHEIYVCDLNLLSDRGRAMIGLALNSVGSATATAPVDEQWCMWT